MADNIADRVVVQIVADASRFKQEVSELQKDLRETQLSVENLKKSTKNTFSDNFKNGFKGFSTTIQNIKKEFEKGWKLNIKTNTKNTSTNNNTSDSNSALVGAAAFGIFGGNKYQKISKEYDDAVNSLRDMTAQAKEYTIQSKDIAKASKDISDQITKRSSGREDYIKSIQTELGLIDNMKSLYSDISKIKSEIKQYQEDNGGTGIPAKYAIELDNLKQKYEQAKQAANDFQAQMEKIWGKSYVTDYQASTQANISTVEYDKVTDELIKNLEITQKYQDDTGNAINDTNDKIKNQAILINNLKDKLKRANDDLAKVNKTAKKTQSILGKIGGFIKRYVILRAIRAAINSVGKSFNEGAKNAYQFSKALKDSQLTEYAKAMDKLATKSLTLKNSVGAAIQGIITAVEPILSKLMTGMTALFNKFSELIAKIRGKDTFMKAVDLQQEWAKAAEETAENMKQLIGGFDELNIFSNKDNSYDASTDYAKMFEESPVERKFKFSDLFDVDEIKSKWQDLVGGIKQSWEDLMPDLKSRMSGLFDGFNFNGIMDLFSNIANLCNDIVLSVVDITTYFTDLIMKSPEAQDMFNLISDSTSKIFGWISKIVGTVTDLSKKLGDILGPSLIELGRSLAEVFATTVEFTTELFGDLGGVANIVELIARLFVPMIRGLSNVIGIINSSLKPILLWVSKLVNSILEAVGSIAGVINAIIDGDWSRLGEEAFKLLKNFIAILASPLDAIMSVFTSFINGITELINRVFKTKLEYAKGFSIGDWVKKLELPKFANGGVVSAPTVSMTGEYAGAKYNPEIIAPQNIMAETFENAQGPVVQTLIQCCRQVVSAIDSKDTSVVIGDQQIVESAYRGNQAYFKRNGVALI